jgi:hypothetical protein
MTTTTALASPNGARSSQRWTEKTKTGKQYNEMWSAGTLLGGLYAECPRLSPINAFLKGFITFTS